MLFTCLGPEKVGWGLASGGSGVAQCEGNTRGEGARDLAKELGTRLIRSWKVVWSIWSEEDEMR